MFLALLSAAIAAVHDAGAPEPARRICRPGPLLPPQAGSTLHNVLIIGDSISLGAMRDITADLNDTATVEHAPFSGDGGALDVKYAMDTDQVMVGAGSGPPWVPGHGSVTRFGDGCLNGTHLVSSTQQPTRYDVISFNYGVHDVCYAGYLEEWVPLDLYRSSIRAVKRTLQATGAKVVFQSSTPVEYNLTTNARILAWNQAAKEVMAEDPPAAYSDLYGAVVAVCGNPPYNDPSVKGSPNCSISDYGGVHYHEGGWQLLARAATDSIKALIKGTTPRHFREPPLSIEPAPGTIFCNAPALLSAAGKDRPTEGHAGDRPWSAACGFPDKFSKMHCNLNIGRNASTAAECEAAALAACDQCHDCDRNVNAWTFTPNLPDPNQHGHCWIGSLASLSECYITPAADGWVGAADFSVAAKTNCPANSTCMVTAYSSTNLGCCMGHGTKAVACPDHVHCCPEGWSCTAECRLGSCSCVPP